MLLIEFLMSGGPFMFIILVVGIAIILVGLERYFTYRFRFGLDAPKFFGELQKYVNGNDIERAKQWCHQHSSSPVANVLGAGLSHCKKSLKHAALAMESESLHWVPLITKRISLIGGLANISTLLGLTGTVTGLIAAFAALDGEVGGSQAQELSGGIAEAMYTTAFGLIVAIPGVLFHLLLSSKAKGLIEDIENYSSKLKKLLTISIHLDENSLDEESREFTSPTAKAKAIKAQLAVDDEDMANFDTQVLKRLVAAKNQKRKSKAETTNTNTDKATKEALAARLAQSQRG